MKLFKSIPLIGLMLSVTASSAFAVGKDSADDTNGKMCQKLAASLIKQDHKAAYSTPAGTKTDDDSGPVSSGTAM